jgi:F-type H+-transporting ATPase subunit b
MGFSWSTFFFQTFNFVVLAYVLHRLFYRPLHEAIDRRRQAVLQALQDAERTRKEAANLEQRLQKQLADLERQREQAVRADREQAEHDRRALLADAAAAMQKQRQEFESALARQRDQMLSGVRADVVREAVELAKRLLSQAADRTFHKQLCLRLIGALNDLPDADRQRIRQSWRPDDGIDLETARDLDPETLEQITKAVAAVLGRPISPELRLRPALLEGVRLRVGGEVWDSSLFDQVPEADRGALTDSDTMKQQTANVVDSAAG